MRIKTEKGFTLLEIMIAVFVLGVGLLGLAHLQITALKTNQSAEHKTQAIFLASDILDRIRANQRAIQQDSGFYEIDIDEESPGCDNPDAPPADLTKRAEFIAKCDLNMWRTQVAAYLPNGNAKVECPDYDAKIEFATCIVTIEWRDIQTDSDNARDDDTPSRIRIEGTIGGQGPL